MQFIMGNLVQLLFAFCKCSNKYIFVIEKLAWQQYFWYVTDVWSPLKSCDAIKSFIKCEHMFTSRMYRNQNMGQFLWKKNIVWMLF